MSATTTPFGNAAAAAQPLYGQSTWTNNNQSLMNYNAALRQRQHDFMIDGRSMTFTQFLDEVCPDPEDPNRSFLILKYQK